MKVSPEPVCPTAAYDLGNLPSLNRFAVFVEYFNVDVDFGNGRLKGWGGLRLQKRHQSNNGKSDELSYRTHLREIKGDRGQRPQLPNSRKNAALAFTNPGEIRGRSGSKTSTP